MSSFVPVAAGGGGQIAKVTLSSTQLLAIFTTPITVIPAAGAGTLIVPSQTMFLYTYGGTAYTDGGGLLATGYAGIALGSLSFGAITTNTFWNQTANRLAVGGAGANQAVTAAGLGVNAAVVVGQTAANPTLGNGTVEVIVPYTVISV